MCWVRLPERARANAKSLAYAPPVCAKTPLFCVALKLLGVPPGARAVDFKHISLGAFWGPDLEMANASYTGDPPEKNVMQLDCENTKYW